MHVSLPHSIEVEYTAALKALEAHIGGWEANVFKLFAGGGVSSFAAGEYCEMLQSLYGIDLRLKTAAFAEHHEWKMAALRAQHPHVPVLVKECEALSGGTVYNHVSGEERHLLPSCFAWDGGVPCTSRTPLSSN